MDRIGEHVQHFGEHQLESMPLHQKGIGLDESLGLCEEELLCFLLCLVPLQGVLLLVEAQGHDVDPKEETVAQQEAVRVEGGLAADRGLVADPHYNEEHEMERPHRRD